MKKNIGKLIEFLPSLVELADKNVLFTLLSLEWHKNSNHWKLVRSIYTYSTDLYDYKNLSLISLFLRTDI